MARSQCSGSCCEQRFVRIKRNQKCNSAGNRIILIERSRLALETDFVNAVCLSISNRIIQLVKDLASGFKEVRSFRRKQSREGAVSLYIQRDGRIRAHILASRHIVPATELIADIGRCNQFIGVHRILCVAELLGNSLSIHGIGAILCREEGCSRFNVGRQRNIGQRDLGGSAGAVRLDIYTYRSASSKLFGECTTRSNGGSVHLNRAALCIDGIVKTQDSSNTALVGNC